MQKILNDFRQWLKDNNIEAATGKAPGGKIAVRLYKQEDRQHIPASFLGVDVDCRVVGKITLRK